MTPTGATASVRRLTRDAVVAMTRTRRGRVLVYRLIDVMRARRWDRHPLDVRYRIDTGGTVPPFVVAGADTVVADVGPYAGCQPSCLRSALAAVDAGGDATFYDLGCGKGRALVVAIEHGFRRIVGVDLSRELLAVAARNLRNVLRGRTPPEPQVELRQEDVTAIGFEGDEIVVFVYHAFGRTPLEQVVRRLEAVSDTAVVWFVYENPVHSDLVDGSTRFRRWYGETVDCDADEVRHHADPGEAVVVWRAGPRPAISRHPTDFRVVVTKPGWRAEVRP